MKGFLSREQKDELLRELRLEKSRRYAERIKTILLLDQGKTYKSIAEHLFLDEGTMANYRKRYKTGGLEGLIVDEYSSKKCFLNEDELMQLSLHLESQIYLSTKEIIAYVKKRFRVEYTASGITKLLKKMNFSYKKPKALPGKADKKKQQEFIVLYNRLKLDGKVYFSDSTHPQYNPVVSYGWFKKGVEFDIFTSSGRHRININGALCLDDMDIVSRSCERVNANSICELLRAIRSKNLKEESLYLVLDNASFNRSKKVRDLARELKINLQYLPPYSPNLNPIERLWKFFKKKTLYNQYYESFEVFSKACMDFFRYARKYRSELETLLTDNFRAMGT